MAIDDRAAWPHRAESPSLTSSASAWTWTSWVELAPKYAIGVPFEIERIALAPAHFLPAGTRHQMMWSIATGDAGSEVEVIQVPGTYFAATSVGHGRSLLTSFPDPVSVPANTRLSFRYAGSHASALAVGNPILMYRVAGASQQVPYDTLIHSTPDLASHWRLNEASGNVLDDVGGISGTVTGTFTRQQVGLLTGDADTAVVIPNGANRASFGDVYEFNGTAAHSIEFLINPSTIDANFRRVIANENSIGGGDGWIVYLQSGTGIAYERQVGNVTFESASSGSGSLVTGTTYHVVCTYGSGVIRVYVDGVLRGEMTGSVTSLVDRTRGLWLGADFTNGGVVGTVDEVAVYSRALTSVEVAAHALAARTVPAAPPTTIGPPLSAQAA